MTQSPGEVIVRPPAGAAVAVVVLAWLADPDPPDVPAAVRGEVLGVRGPATVEVGFDVKVVLDGAGWVGGTVVVSA